MAFVPVAIHHCGDPSTGRVDIGELRPIEVMSRAAHMLREMPAIEELLRSKRAAPRSAEAFVSSLAAAGPGLDGSAGHNRSMRTHSVLIPTPSGRPTTGQGTGALGCHRSARHPAVR